MHPLRTYLTVDSTTDIARWLHKINQLHDDEVELSWYSGAWLFWEEFYLNALHDIYLLAAAFAALLIILSNMLGMPLFALLSLSIVVVSFPVAFAAYCAAFEEEKLPLLAVVSLYLVLGIAVDAIFIFTNSYAMEHEVAVGELTEATTPDEDREPPSTATWESGSSSSSARTSLTYDGDSMRAQGPLVGEVVADTEWCSTEQVTLRQVTLTLRRKDEESNASAAAPQMRSVVRTSAVLSKTLVHAGFVSGLSMLTTSVAFGASIFSPISVIRSFAAFQTLLVVIDYALLVLLLVPLIVCWRRRICQPQQRLAPHTANAAGTGITRAPTAFEVSSNPALLPLPPCGKLQLLSPHLALEGVALAVACSWLLFRGSCSPACDPRVASLLAQNHRAEDAPCAPPIARTLGGVVPAPSQLLHTNTTRLGSSQGFSTLTILWSVGCTSCAMRLQPALPYWMGRRKRRAGFGMNARCILRIG